MRIQVSGGYVGEVACELRDRRGSDLAIASLKMALLPVGVLKGQGMPGAGEGSWKTPLVSVLQGEGSETRARLSIQVSSATGLGRYHVWVLYAAGGLLVPVPCSNEVVELV